LEVSGQLHAPAASPPGKSFRYSFDRRMCGLLLYSSIMEKLFTTCREADEGDLKDREDVDPLIISLE
jgi:hypothetical protein